MATAWSLPRFGQVRDDRELQFANSARSRLWHRQLQWQKQDYLRSDMIEEL